MTSSRGAEPESTTRNGSAIRPGLAPLERHAGPRVGRGVDLELPERELVVLLGASGSGKSTLLDILGGWTSQRDMQSCNQNSELRGWETIEWE